jgi:hypothetical protein
MLTDYYFLIWTLKDSQKEELVQGQKKLLKVTEALLEAY